MSTSRSAALALLIFVGATLGAPAYGQISGPPMGGSYSWGSLGPPTGTVQDFIGSWDLTWDGPTGSHCPCRGTLTVEMKETADGSGLAGTWTAKGPAAVLSGGVSYDQNVWAGRFAQPDDASDYPMRGYFRLEARGSGRLTGSYRLEGTAVPFSWNGTRN
ncbi:MAG: hypothetical protein ACHQK9_04680 [Reyranellales bacterium]